MAPLDVPGLLQQIAASRPVFHSEADFQHAFAWAIHQAMPNAELRLEVPLSVGGPGVESRYAVDILVREGGRLIPIELKYLKAPTQVDLDGENFHLRPGGAQDIRRYDIVKDVVRVEQLVAELAAPCGYAITLTNDGAYWRAPARKDTADEAFRIHDGRTLRGQMRWSEAASPGTTKNRAAPLTLGGSYQLAWRDYSALDASNGRFRYLLVEVPLTAD